jgi:hypothetical protein
MLPANAMTGQLSPGLSRLAADKYGAMMLALAVTRPRRRFRHLY